MKIGVAVSPLESHIGYWLRHLSNEVSLAFMRRLDVEGVTVPEWVVMRDLLELGEVASSLLAERMGMTRGGLSKLIERLVAKGFVERDAGEGDRRFRTLALSESGRLLVPRLAVRADENDAEFFGHLDPAQRAELLDLLREVAGRRGAMTHPIE